MSDKIHLFSLSPTSCFLERSQWAKKKIEKRTIVFFCSSVFVCVCFFRTRVVKAKLKDAMMDKQSERWSMHPEDIKLLSQASVLHRNDPP